ncbi:MAG: dTDP-4-dehydrorhamnose 3,5-epimerase family protein [Alphaproteobacteria bacterium]|nr:dTDP-4-dehydrorhamnose 3,5-epimerase family protein [Alphaproteobacteria bacterium]
MYEVEPTAIPGCLMLRPIVRQDARGAFVKIFHRPFFAGLGFDLDFAEIYVSRSRKGVVRGLHFQAPPADHDKLVCCLDGRILDAVLDLRRGSPTEGRHLLFPLNGDQSAIVLVPRGCAHGFLAESEGAQVAYAVTSAYDPARDLGVRWDGAGIPWPIDDPVVSERDAGFPALAEFDSPFVWPTP